MIIEAPDCKPGTRSHDLRSALGLRSDQTPFPWQERLLDQMVRGVIPRSLDIPTGLGKTSAMAIWLLARAAGASLPRRLVYVVDRRAVVDQATEVALGLRRWVAERPQVADALGLVSSQQLPISTLRGQFVDNREWLEDPSRPAIIVGTVDMVGSRLLFEGYGVTRKMRPYHAGLLGSDTLLLLDEAHLVSPFERLLDQATQMVGGQNRPGDSLPPRSVLMSLSATGRGHGGRVFDLDEADLCHDIVKKRLRSRKRLSVRTHHAGDGLAEAIAHEAWSLAGEGDRPIRCLVYTDRRDDAERVLETLRKLSKPTTRKRGAPLRAHLELLVGARRIYERSDAADRLNKLGFFSGSQEELDKPAFVIATSAGEVGVDLDAEHVVCDLVAWERMVQRLGRVNRLGKGDAEVRVLVLGSVSGDRRTGLIRRWLSQPALFTVRELTDSGKLSKILANAAWKASELSARPARFLVLVSKAGTAKNVADELCRLSGAGKKKKDQPPRAEVVLLDDDASRYERPSSLWASDSSPGSIPTFAVSAGRPEELLMRADHVFCAPGTASRAANTTARMTRGSPPVIHGLVDAPEKKQPSFQALVRREAARLLLERLPAMDGGRRSAGPGPLMELTLSAREDPSIARLLRRAATPAPLYPALNLPALEAWSCTSLRDHTGRPEVAPWLRGWVDDKPQTRVAWRAELPIPADRDPKPRDIELYFEAAPVHTSEVLETESWRVSEWLFKRVKAVKKRIDKGKVELRQDSPWAFMLDGSGAFQRCWTFAELSRLADEPKRIRDRTERQLGGATLVVWSELGGLDHGLLSTGKHDCPDTVDGECWFEAGFDASPPVRFRVAYTTKHDALDEGPWHERLRLPVAHSGDDEVLRWLVVQKWRHDAATEDDRSAGPPQLLTAHQSSVEQRADSLCDRLSIPNDIRVALLLAARHHDEGKAAPRWQRAFSAPGDGKLL